MLVSWGTGLAEIKILSDLKFEVIKEFNDVL